MTYDASELAATGRPVELYEFLSGSTLLRHTSAANVQTNGANSYAPYPIKRTEPSQSKDERSGMLELTVPAEMEFIQPFRKILPSRLPSLTIFRKHVHDPDQQVVVFWKGFISSVNFQDRVAQIACQPITRVLSQEMPRVVYSGLCNHVLYDAGCRVVREDFSHSNDIDLVENSGLHVRVPGARDKAALIAPTLASADLDVFFQGGYMVVDGEYRMILEGNVGGDPNMFRLLLPFQELPTGKSAQVFAGCNHTIAICAAKFANNLRFGGFPYIPNVNPFNIDLGGQQVS